MLRTGAGFGICVPGKKYTDGFIVTPSFICCCTAAMMSCPNCRILCSERGIGSPDACVEASYDAFMEVCQLCVTTSILQSDHALFGLSVVCIVSDFTNIWRCQDFAARLVVLCALCILAPFSKGKTAGWLAMIFLV